MTPRETRCRVCNALEPDGNMETCARCILDAMDLGNWCHHHGAFSLQTYTVEPFPGMTYQQYRPREEQACPWCCASHGPLIAGTCPTCEALAWADLLLAIAPPGQNKEATS